mmetsp:Transcript_76963/g.213897  ORF Transcript_76963/g.213897 Transcript_76963/m.213897 type:complete len:218 (+) Transcript_76963:60-713(+)
MHASTQAQLPRGTSARVAADVEPLEAPTQDLQKNFSHGGGSNHPSRTSPRCRIEFLVEDTELPDAVRLDLAAQGHVNRLVVVRPAVADGMPADAPATCATGLRGSGSGPLGGRGRCRLRRHRVATGHHGRGCRGNGRLVADEGRRGQANIASERWQRRRHEAQRRRRVALGLVRRIAGDAYLHWLRHIDRRRLNMRRHHCLRRLHAGIALTRCCGPS